MTDQITIFHNPRCSKSRQTLALLEEKGIEPDVVRYLETPPTAVQLRDLLAKLGLTARQLLRTKEDEYRELGLNDPSIGEERLIEAMVSHPKLIERPIVVRGKKAVLGRPPESVLDLL